MSNILIINDMIMYINLIKKPHRCRAYAQSAVAQTATAVLRNETMLLRVILI